MFAFPQTPMQILVVCLRQIIGKLKYPTLGHQTSMYQLSALFKQSMYSSEGQQM